MHFDQGSKKSLQLQKAVRRGIRSSAGLYVHILKGQFDIFLVHESLPHILFWLNLAWAVSLKQVHVKIATHADTYSPCSEVFRIFSSFPVSAVIANWSGPNWALVGNKAQSRLYLQASVFPEYTGNNSRLLQSEQTHLNTATASGRPTSWLRAR